MVSWVLGVAAISILITPFVYFPLNYAWDQIALAITGSYTFTGVTAYALIVVQLIISYLCAFALIFTVAWAIVQAKARSYEA